jgi:hypothetical protein
VTEAHLDNERELLRALSASEQRRLADLLRKLQLGLPPLERIGAENSACRGDTLERVWQ